MTPHNPDNLSEETVGTAEGYRLLDEDEITGGKQAKEIELWRDQREWAASSCGACKELTYRTRLTRFELLCLRNGHGLPTSPSHPDPKPQGVVLPNWLLSLVTACLFVCLLILVYILTHL